MPIEAPTKVPTVKLPDLDEADIAEALSRGHLTAVSWDLTDEKLDLSSWVLLGDGAIGTEGGHQWWVGDWYNRGRQLFEERADQLTEARFGARLSLKTIKKYANVCAKIGAPDRVAELDFAVHRETMALGRIVEIRKALKQAKAQRWSSRDMAAYVRAQTADDETKAEPDKAEPSRVAITLMVWLQASDRRHGPAVLAAAREAAEKTLAELGIDDARIEERQPLQAVA